jgi:hypothetical protein
MLEDQLDAKQVFESENKPDHRRLLRETPADTTKPINGAANSEQALAENTVNAAEATSETPTNTKNPMPGLHTAEYADRYNGQSLRQF